MAAHLYCTESCFETVFIVKSATVKLTIYIMMCYSNISQATRVKLLKLEHIKSVKINVITAQ